MSRPVLTGKTVSFRLPLATDATLRGQASAAKVSPGRFAARAVVRDMAAVEDHDVTVTVTMGARLFAALEAAGALTVVTDDDDDDEEGVPAPSPGPAPLDPADPRIPAHLAARIKREPSAAEPASRGGVGTVPGCEHRHSIALGSLRKCAVCKAVRGVDGVWRAP